MPDVVPIEEQKRLIMEATLREVYDMRVFVVGGGFQYLKMFFDAGFKGAKGVDDADVICFTGGADVDPKMYGEEPIPGTEFNPERDARESFIYGLALADKKPMIGICRGAQFLNVMNGGKLWQDVDGHAVYDGHPVVDFRTGKTINKMTSTHHQQMIEGPGAEIIAAAEISTRKKGHNSMIARDKPELDDLEVVWYPDSLSLCFQPHPEFQHGECRNYFLDLVDQYILPSAT